MPKLSAVVITDDLLRSMKRGDSVTDSVSRGLTARRGANDIAWTLRWKDATGQHAAVIGRWPGVGVDAARGLQAGIVVLALASRGELESVAKAVALLRGFGRARIKVVVREVGHRCRLADTVALLRLGASAVCPASADGATLRALVDTLRGSGYLRPVIADVETAYRSSRGDFSGTPLLPRAFAAHARRLLQPGPFAMPNLLVQLPAGADQLAALSRRIVARRIRDVMVTALDGRVWMFVSGCARPQLPIVLERLFGARAVAFERAVQCHAEPDAILECLARFGVEADDAPPPVVAREVAADAIA